MSIAAVALKNENSAPLNRLEDLFWRTVMFGIGVYESSRIPSKALHNFRVGNERKDRLNQKNYGRILFREDPDFTVLDYVVSGIKSDWAFSKKFLYEGAIKGEDGLLYPELGH